MHQVVEARPARAQQGLDVGDGVVELAQRVARMHDRAGAVDARGSGNEQVGAVGVGDACAALERDVIVLGRAQPVEVVEIGNLRGNETKNRIGVHGDEIVAVRARALDPGAGDEVGGAGHPLLGEQLAPAVDHVLIKDVDVLEVDPRPDAMIAERAALAREGADEIVEQLPRLRRRRHRRAAGAGAEPGAPEMAEAVPLDEHVPRRQAAFHGLAPAFDVIGEERDLRAGQRRLLHDRDGDGAAGRIEGQAAGADPRHLVDRVAEEEPAEDRGFGREPEGLARRRVAVLDKLDQVLKTEFSRRLHADEVLRAAVRPVEASAGDSAVHAPGAASDPWNGPAASRRQGIGFAVERHDRRGSRRHDTAIGRSGKQS